MAKRLTDSDKWKDDWYISLCNDHKVVWQWLIDNCTHSGLCKRSMGLLNMMCRVSLKETEMLEILEGRAIIHGSFWFIPNFLKFQYPTLMSNKPAILSVVKDIFTHNLVPIIPESFGNHYKIISESFDNHCKMIKDTVKNTVTVKDKDKVTVEESIGGILNFSKTEKEPENWRNACSEFMNDFGYKTKFANAKGLTLDEVSKRMGEFILELTLKEKYMDVAGMKTYFVNSYKVYVEGERRKTKGANGSAAFHEVEKNFNHEAENVGKW